MPTIMLLQPYTFRDFHKDDLDLDTWSLLPQQFNVTDKNEHLVNNCDIFLQQVVVQESIDKTFQVVIGQNIIASQTLFPTKVNSYHCLVLPPTFPVTDTLHIICAYYKQQLIESPIALAYFLAKCLRYIEDKQVVIQEFFPVLQLKQNNKIISDCFKLLDLDIPTQQKFHDGQLSNKLTTNLLKLVAVDRLKIVEVVTQLNLGNSKQKRFLELSTELANRKNISIQQLLNEDEFKNLLNQHDGNIPQITHQVLQLLQEKCFPKSSAAIKEFMVRKQNLKLPKNCDLQHTQAFEKDEVTLTITYQSLDDFENKWKELQQITS